MSIGQSSAVKSRDGMMMEVISQTNRIETNLNDLNNRLSHVCSKMFGEIPSAESKKGPSAAKAVAGDLGEVMYSLDRFEIIMQDINGSLTRLEKL